MPYKFNPFTGKLDVIDTSVVGDNLGNHTASQEIIVPNMADPTPTVGQAKISAAAGKLKITAGDGETIVLP